MRLGSSNKAALLGLIPFRVATATNQWGEVVLTVRYTTVGKSFLIEEFSVLPTATVKEAQRAGDVIDSLLETEARPLGITSLLMVSPGTNEAKEIRTYNKDSQSVATLPMGKTHRVLPT
jgi:hypothetical protein